MTAHSIPQAVPAVDTRRASDLVAPDCRGLNFYAIDRALQALLGLYCPAPLRAHLEPHLQRLGELAGGRLDELAEQADKHPPLLRPRDRYGRDEAWIEYHPAYREMERIAFAEFGLHAMSHRAGVLGWPEPMPPVAKYAFQYLFSQAEFGLMCPISVTDTSAHLLEQFAEPALRERLVPRMLEQELEALWKGTQFMTEKAGGSDVGGIETSARREGDHWRLTGEKWFCSHTDGDVALLLARPEGAPGGTGGLGLFAMPWRLEDGSRNAYRIVRLKDKLGSRSMASGEVVLEGALAWQVGRLDRGLKQMLEQVNLSRLSHGVRAAGMMRRCLNESLQVARNRRAFGRRLIELPLLRRQLLKLLVPTEQALSMALYTAHTMGAANGGDATARATLRILTPLLKLRACRDNVRVATGAMEVRGGNGYIEDWVNARLVRDAHLGVLWEGTSNINALDVVTRAVRKHAAHEPLAEGLSERLSAAEGAPAAFRAQLKETLARAGAFAARIADGPQSEPLARQAATGLYNAASAALLAWEGARVGAAGGDARRLLLARMVLAHRLQPRDPLAAGEEGWEAQAAALLLDEAPVPLAVAARLVAQG
jgi:alkylation response protein AidB-like acyl-CoA dehydrogenase